MAKNFWDVVNKVIYDSDILLLFSTQRLVQETRNVEIEKKVAGAKSTPYVITKCDLVDKEYS
jgi:ribosome biogenesis GTPase A